jgi:hypothetical protein
MKELILSPLINVLFFSFALAWILKLEKTGCDCSQDWRRDYMKYYFGFAILFQFLILMQKYPKFLLVPFALASLAYLGVCISYIMDLRKQGCGCAQSMEQSVLLWVSAFQVVTLLFAGGLLVYLTRV